MSTYAISPHIVYAHVDDMSCFWECGVSRVVVYPNACIHCHYCQVCDINLSISFSGQQIGGQ